MVAKVSLGDQIDSIMKKGFEFYPQLQEEVKVTRGYKTGTEIPDTEVEYRDPLTGEIETQAKVEGSPLADDKQEYDIVVIRYTEQMSLAPFEGTGYLREPKTMVWTLDKEYSPKMMDVFHFKDQPYQVDDYRLRGIAKFISLRKMQ